MKILYFSPGLNPHDQRFLTALAGTSYEVHFLHKESHLFNGLPKSVTQHRLTANGTGHSQSSLENYQRVLEVVKPDLVHAGPLQDCAWIAARAGTSNLVAMSWAADLLFWFDRQDDTRQKILETLERTSILVGDCEAVAQKAVSLGFPRQRITLFPWGVDLEHFHPAADERRLLPSGWEDSFIVLSNRSFEPIYGVDVLVKAFSRAARLAPGLRLILYGKGSMEAELHAMVEASDISDKVCFAGFASLAELPSVYQSADVFVTASHCDGSSVSLMEALACGKPVIASDIAGNLEWVREGENGWIFSDGDESQLAEVLVDASNSNQLLNMGNSARKLAEARADWRLNFPVLLSGYEKAIRMRGQS